MERELVYIMGRGHSGTTVLDGLLGNGKTIMAVGELVSGIGRYESLCGCGVRISDCPFWKQVRTRFEETSGYTWESAVKHTKGQAHSRNYIRSLITYPKSWKPLRDITRELLDSIRDVSGKRLVVDSSKEPTRGLFLAKAFPEAKIIHLIRDPVKIIASDYFRIRDGTGFRFLRKNYSGATVPSFFLSLSAVNWTLGNIMGEIVRRISPDRVLQVRFEDLCANPRATLSKIGDFIEADLSDVITAVEQGYTLELRHKIAGNRLRMKGSFVFNPARQTGRDLPRKYQRMVEFVDLPMRKYYGY